MEKDNMVRDLKVFILANDSKFNMPDSKFDLLLNDTNIYLICKDDLRLRSLNFQGINKELSDLKYADLFNFKRIFENFKNDKISDFQFFTYRGLRHLIYPFKTKDDNIYIAIMEKRIKLIDDFFKRKY